jgi:hypothetical protein
MTTMRITVARREPPMMRRPLVKLSEDMCPEEDEDEDDSSDEMVSLRKVRGLLTWPSIEFSSV